MDWIFILSIWLFILFLGFKDIVSKIKLYQNYEEFKRINNIKKRTNND